MLEKRQFYFTRNDLSFFVLQTYLVQLPPFIFTEKGKKCNKESSQSKMWNISLLFYSSKVQLRIPFSQSSKIYAPENVSSLSQSQDRSTLSTKQVKKEEQNMASPKYRLIHFRQKSTWCLHLTLGRLKSKLFHGKI